jgi:hypothetical protein
MPGLVRGIHAFFVPRQDVDGRDKHGHDEGGVMTESCRPKNGNGADQAPWARSAPPLFSAGDERG